jgi:hypothetical protein
LGPSGFEPPGNIACAAWKSLEDRSGVTRDPQAAIACNSSVLQPELLEGRSGVRVDLVVFAKSFVGKDFGRQIDLFL